MSTKLHHMKGWNPYYLYDNNGNRHELVSITIYHPDGSGIYIDHGWFDNGNNRVGSINIPDVVLRRKLNLDGKTFILSKAGKASLYIPYGFFGFEKSEHIETRGFIKRVYDCYTSNVYPDLSFIYYASMRTIEDYTLRAKTERLLTIKRAIQSTYDVVKKELDELDPDGYLEKTQKNGDIDQNILNFVTLTIKSVLNPKNR